MHARDGSLKGAARVVYALLVAMLVFTWSFAMFSRSAFAARADEAERAVDDTVIRGGFKVKKVLPLGNAQGDTSVAKTEFAVYAVHGSVRVGGVWYRGIDLDGDEAVPCYVGYADENGVVESAADLLPYGTYRIVEQKVMEGQQKAKIKGADWSHEFTIREEGVIIDAGEVENPPDRVSIRVTKKDNTTEDGSAQGDTSMAGCEFTVYNRSAAPIEYIKGNTRKVVPVDGVVDVMVTNEKGEASLPKDSLEYGTYEVIETKAPEGYKLTNPTWRSGNIVCHEAGKTFDAGVAKNPVGRGGAVLIKMDRELDGSVAQGDAKLNAEFTVYNRSKSAVFVGSELVEVGGVVYRGRANEVSGKLTIPANTLPIGTYEVRETAPAYGYLIDEDWSWKFSIENDGEVKTCPDSAANKNLISRGGIRVLKVDADTGESAPQGDGTLEGIGIDIYNASAGTIVVGGKQYAPGEKVMTITTVKTDEGYVAETAADALPFGTYELRESSVPAETGYLINLAWNPRVVITENGGIASEVVPSDYVGS